MNRRPVRETRDDRFGGNGVVVRGTPVAAIVSLIGLTIVALATVAVFTGKLPFLPTGGGTGGGGAMTPAPSNVVVVDPRTKVPGSIVYAKGGNIWIQSGSEARQLTSSGFDAMPTWSADGQWIYYVETRNERGVYPWLGAAANYQLTYPIVTRIHPDGSGKQAIKSGKYTFSGGRYQWFYWIRQPVPDRTGTKLAVVSDAPEPIRNDVVVQLLDISGGTLSKPSIPENAPLGHQDPAWKPVGTALLLYVMNGRDGTRAAPSIWAWNPKTKKAKALTAPGYLAPSWSPDGRWIAATKQASVGTDIVILDASTGSEVLRLTKDGRSWGPVWSPAGDSIAFLHMDAGVTDLQLLKLTGSGPAWTVGEVLPLTQMSALDPSSRPSWYIPPEQMPPPTPAPATSAPASATAIP